MCRYVINQHRDSSSLWTDEWTPLFGDSEIQRVHRSLPEYSPTPTVSLPALARSLGVSAIHVKDESQRFGLKAFKALGASYAVYRLFKQHGKTHSYQCPPSGEFYRAESPIPSESLIFCTATDGNHGRGVAWVARKLGQHAVIYMPRGAVLARIDKIRSEGADVVIVDGDYDCAVRTAAAAAERHGWQIVSDTSWPGYDVVPRWIMAGYTTMFREIHDPPNAVPSPDVVIVQGGVGALAAVASWYYNQRTISNRPRLVSVEPASASCLLESVESPDGGPVQSQGTQESIMAGLNCGTPSVIAWPLIKRGFDLFMSISDDWCTRAMRAYYHPQKRDPRIISGESGAAGLASLLALTQSESLASARKCLELNENSRVLLFNTEGDTDPGSFREIVAGAQVIPD